MLGIIKICKEFECKGKQYIVYCLLPVISYALIVMSTVYIPIAFIAYSAFLVFVAVGQRVRLFVTKDGDNITACYMLYWLTKNIITQAIIYCILRSVFRV